MTNSRWMGVLVSVVVIGWSGGASAQGQAGPPSVPPSPPPTVELSPKELRSFAITISPLHLILPMVELAAELKLGPKMSVVGIGGAGSIEGAGLDNRVTVYEVGGQFRYYALGDFDSGLQIGAEALYVGGRANEGDVSAVADGLALGPFIGYKWTSSAGFTVDLQGGVEFVTFRAESSAGNTAEDADVIPLLNVNLGWAL